MNLKIKEADNLLVKSFFDEARVLLVCQICRSKVFKFRQCVFGHPVCYDCSDLSLHCLCGAYINGTRCNVLENMVECIWTDGSMDAICKLLECSICYNRVTPANYRICYRGHPVCVECKLKIIDCPICKAMYYCGRNTLLVYLMEIFPYRCKYEESGCDFYERHRILTIHEKDCDFRSRSCKIPNCVFYGNKDELITHFIRRHETNFLSTDYIEIKVTKNLNSDVIYLVESHNFFFWQHYRFTEKEISFDIQLIGNKEQADIFKVLSFVDGVNKFHNVTQDNYTIPYMLPNYQSNNWLLDDDTCEEKVFSTRILKRKETTVKVTDKLSNRFFTFGVPFVVVSSILLFRKPRFVFYNVTKLTYCNFSKFFYLPKLN